MDGLSCEVSEVEAQHLDSRPWDTNIANLACKSRTQSATPGSGQQNATFFFFPHIVLLPLFELQPYQLFRFHCSLVQGPVALHVPVNNFFFFY